MKIEKKSKKKNIAFVLGALAILFLMILLFSVFKSVSKKEAPKEPVLIEGRNYVNTSGLDVEKLLNDKLYIYDDNDLSIFALQDPYESKIVFAYKEEPQERKKDDKFFIHIYPKDSTLIKEPYINFTFVSNDFDKQTIASKDYFFIEKVLLSNLFKEKYVLFEAIDHINLGRFNSGLGRSFSKENLQIPIDKIINFNAKVIIPENSQSEQYVVNTIDLFTSQKSFDKVKLKRDKALEVGVLLTDEDDIVKGDLSLNGGEKIKVEFRLKGDWTDHLNEKNKWSYRVIAKGDETILGMRKISIQHPKSRNFQWEWLFNKIIKDEGLIGLRYDFIKFNLQVKDKGIIDNGIMALEESFDKILIENNKKREGIIIGFDEDLLWKDRYRQKELSLEDNTQDFDNLGSVTNARVKVYNEGKVLKDPKLLKQFNVAKDLLEGLRDDKYKISEVFDIDKLTTFVALTNLFGADHSLIWHNLRIYYNPITNKLEPVSFDSNAGIRKTSIKHYPFSNQDSIYSKALVEKLAVYSSQEYLNKVSSRHGGKLNSITELLENTFRTHNFDVKTLEYNSNFIKKYIYPIEIIATDFISQNKNELVLDIKNISHFPVAITGIYHNDGQKLNKEESPILLNSKKKQKVVFLLKDAFNNV